MVEETKLTRFRREILRAVETPEQAQELVMLLIDTNWLEVGRIDHETRKVSCNGCFKTGLYKAMKHVGVSGLYCPKCDSAVTMGFTCECENCKQKFISHDYKLYHDPSTACRVPFRLCYECAVKREEKFRQQYTSDKECLACRKMYQTKEPDNVSICASCKTAHGIDDQTIRREYQKLNSHQIRASTLGLPDTLTLDEWFAAILHFDWLCAYCLTLPYEHFDHFIPLCKGGGTVKENCVPSCLNCNNGKGQRHPDKVTAIPQEDMKRVQTYLQI